MSDENLTCAEAVLARANAVVDFCIPFADYYGGTDGINVADANRLQSPYCDLAGVVATINAFWNSVPSRDQRMAVLRAVTSMNEAELCRLLAAFAQLVEYDEVEQGPLSPIYPVPTLVQLTAAHDVFVGCNRPDDASRMRYHISMRNAADAIVLR